MVNIPKYIAYGAALGAFAFNTYTFTELVQMRESDSIAECRKQAPRIAGGSVGAVAFIGIALAAGSRINRI
jgi:hypothetical protein